MIVGAGNIIKLAIVIVGWSATGMNAYGRHFSYLLDNVTYASRQHACKLDNVTKKLRRQHHVVVCFI